MQTDKTYSQESGQLSPTVTRDILFLGNALATVPSKAELQGLLKNIIHRFLSVANTAIVLVDETQTPFLVSFADNQHDRILSEFLGLSPLSDKIYQLIISADAPTLVDLDEVIVKTPAHNLLHALHHAGFRTLAAMALRQGEKIRGAIFCFAPDQKRFASSDLLLLHGLSFPLATAMANIVAHEGLAQAEKEKSFLLSLGHDMASMRSKRDLMTVIRRPLKEQFSFHDAGIATLNSDGQTYGDFLFSHEDQASDMGDPKAYSIHDALWRAVVASETPVVFDLDILRHDADAPSYISSLYQLGMREMVALRLCDRTHAIGYFYMLSEQRHSFAATQHGLLAGVANQLSVAVANINANEKTEGQLLEIERYKQQLEVENLYLQEEIGTYCNPADIVGNSAVMQKVYQLVSRVAAVDSTVLLLGETGTGKELIARAIHNASSRSEKLMVKLNCAALPANLIESELFGHERGSFTGAIERRIGKFELAHRGTLFLDEVGEMPMELQVKLLRALQEKEIERVGGKTVINVDVRIIASTNRNLQQDVHTGKFRSDLFYRLNVFPITLPPLRERLEDIAPLATHFMARFARREGKKITHISRKALQQLMGYSWPGNVRELEHLVEQSVLLTSGSTVKEIHLPQSQRKEIYPIHAEALHTKTLDENERDHILAVLKKCHGKISGPGGAADLLGVPSTTLNSKMKRLGIKRGYSFDAWQ